MDVNAKSISRRENAHIKDRNGCQSIKSAL